MNLALAGWDSENQIDSFKRRIVAIDSENQSAGNGAVGPVWDL